MSHNFQFVSVLFLLLLLLFCVLYISHLFDADEENEVRSPHTKPCGHLWNCRCWLVHWWNSWCMCTWGCVCVPDEVHVEMMRVVGARGDRWCGGFGSQSHQMHYCVAVGGTGVTCVQGHNLPSSAPFVWKTKLLPLVYLLWALCFFRQPLLPQTKSHEIYCVDSALSV